MALARVDLGEHESRGHGPLGVGGAGRRALGGARLEDVGWVRRPRPFGRRVSARTESRGRGVESAAVRGRRGLLDVNVGPREGRGDVRLEGLGAEPLVPGRRGAVVGAPRGFGRVRVGAAAFVVGDVSEVEEPEEEEEPDEDERQEQVDGLVPRRLLVEEGKGGIRHNVRAGDDKFAGAEGGAEVAGQDGASDAREEERGQDRVAQRDAEHGERDGPEAEVARDLRRREEPKAYCREAHGQDAADSCGVREHAPV